jgi:hypothetical protein
MEWKDVAGIVGKAAPLLGTLIGGPAGAAVGGLISAALGTEATPDAVSQAIAANPDAALKLAQFESDNRVKLQGMTFAHTEAVIASEISRYQAEAADRDSARKAAVAGGTAKPLFWLSLLLLAGTLGTEITVLFAGYPTTVSEIIVGRVLGLMDSVALMVLAFWYGSSSSSVRKTEILAQAEPVKAT